MEVHVYQNPKTKKQRSDRNSTKTCCEIHNTTVEPLCPNSIVMSFPNAGNEEQLLTTVQGEKERERKRLVPYIDNQELAFNFLRRHGICNRE